MVGHHILALKALHKGLGKLAVNEKALAKDLEKSPEVLGEAVQTVMRRYGVVDAYERLKAATRGQAVTRDALLKIISACGELPEEAKNSLKDLTPATYIGLAGRLVREFMK